jgi:hypothetical protein
MSLDRRNRSSRAQFHLDIEIVRIQYNIIARQKYSRIGGRVFRPDVDG